MAEYYIYMNKAYRPDKKKSVFFGPYSRQFQAEAQVDRIKPHYEIILNEDEIPNDLGSALFVKILTGTEAKRTGMKAEGKKQNLLGTVIPESYEDIQKELDRVRSVGIDGELESEIREPEYISIDDEVAPPIEDEPEDIIEKEKEMGMGSFYNNNGVQHQEFSPRPIKSRTSYEVRAEAEKADAIVVTRDPINTDYIEWLRREGIGGQILTWVRNGREIAGKRVVGTLPYRNASKAKAVGEMFYNDPSKVYNTRTPKLEELIAADAEIDWYRVIKEEGAWAKILFFLDDPDNFQKVLEMAEQQR